MNFIPNIVDETDFNNTAYVGFCVSFHCVSTCWNFSRKVETVSLEARRCWFCFLCFFVCVAKHVQFRVPSLLWASSSGSVRQVNLQCKKRNEVLSHAYL